MMSNTPRQAVIAGDTLCPESKSGRSRQTQNDSESDAFKAFVGQAQTWVTQVRSRHALTQERLTLLCEQLEGLVSTLDGIRRDLKLPGTQRLSVGQAVHMFYLEKALHNDALALVRREPSGSLRDVAAQINAALLRREESVGHNNGQPSWFILPPVGMR